MFRLQVFKMGLTKTALETKQQQQRYFTADEIHGLFEWTYPACGETRQLLIEKHGEEDVAAARGDGAHDGAHDGWAAAGPAVGMSNFSTLYTLAEEEDELEEMTPAVREMRSKLNAAEQEAQKAAQERQSIEGSLSEAQEQLEVAADEITAAVNA